MKRSDFLRTMAATMVVAAPAAEPPYKGRRRVSDLSHDIPATPEAIFPLLCPVREEEWIDGWKANVVHSRSGVAEQDCVFTTLLDVGPSVWTCCRYEPPRHIEYVAVMGRLSLMHLSIDLQPTAHGTRLRWQRVYTSLSAEGEAQLDAWTPAHEQKLNDRLSHFLTTGKMLRSPANPHSEGR